MLHLKPVTGDFQTHIKTLNKNREVNRKEGLVAVLPYLLGLFWWLALRTTKACFPRILLRVFQRYPTLRVIEIRVTKGSKMLRSLLLTLPKSPTLLILSLLEAVIRAGRNCRHCSRARSMNPHRRILILTQPNTKSALITNQ